MVIKFIKTCDIHPSYISLEPVISDNKNRKFNSWNDMKKFLEKLEYRNISVVLYKYFSNTAEFGKIADLLQGEYTPVSGRILVNDSIYD